MEIVGFEEIESMIKNRKLNYYNFYNSDFSIPNYYSLRYYHDQSYDNIETAQKLHTVFLDIEVFTDNLGFKEINPAIQPINCITIHSDHTNIYKSFYLLLDRNYKKFGIEDNDNFDLPSLLELKSLEFKRRLFEGNYISNEDEIQIELNVYNSEKDLLLDCWKEIHNYDPFILSGFNSDEFDYPYIYYRLVEILGSKTEVDKVLSKLGQVDVRGKYINISDFVIADLLHLYKPRADGGLNLGEKLPSFSLDSISSYELGLEKIKYKDSHISLDNLYLNDPSEFLLYNIGDTLLTQKLDQKLKHINLYNMIRRNMYTPMSAAMNGSSPMYETFVYSELLKDNKVVRFGINSELGKTFEPDEFKDIPVPGDKKGKLTPIKISKEAYTSWTTKFPGAYVKVPRAGIINDGSLIIDLDATSLYPSKILESNISFDSYRHRILPPTTYTILNLLKNTLGKSVLPKELPQKVFELVDKYIDSEDIQKKNESKTILYYLTMYFFHLLSNSGLTFERICNPTNDQSSLLLKLGLLPLLDIINIIHPNNLGFNQFIYDYLFLDKENVLKKYQQIYIIKNSDKPNLNIDILSVDETLNFIKDYSITIAGTCFTKHEDKIGLFAEFLTNMGKLRSKYKKQRDSYPKGSEEYILNDSRQSAVKVISNTSYGLYGLSSFKFSNHWLAQSITSQGILTNKIAQYLTNEYLDYKYKE